MKEETETQRSSVSYPQLNSYYVAEIEELSLFISYDQIWPSKDQQTGNQE